MRIIINIDDNLYTRLFDNGVDNYDDAEDMATAIRKGMVLPRGCGRLVDADVLDNGLREQQKSYEHTFGVRQLINEAVRDGIIIARTHIKYAPTIIEKEM